MTAPRVLILGGSGMLGHKLWQVFSPLFDTHATIRGRHDVLARAGVLDPTHSIANVSAVTARSRFAQWLGIE